MTPKRLAIQFAAVNLIHCRRKWVGNPFAEGLRRLSHNFAVINLIHCRRVRRRDLSAKGRPPTKGCPPLSGLL
ncbi:MAG: hypothetical protein LBK82_08490 [Planctomycetaceae bacterium]|nr:hypothetical protein [Planctomycetaceae bacterium]